MEMVWLILFLCARVEQLAGKVVENEPLRTVQTREVEIERPSLDWLIDSRLKLDSRFNLYHFHTHTRFGARILATRTFRVAGVCILLTQTFRAAWVCILPTHTFGPILLKSWENNLKLKVRCARTFSEEIHIKSGLYIETVSSLRVRPLLSDGKIRGTIN